MDGSNSVRVLPGFYVPRSGTLHRVECQRPVDGAATIMQVETFEDLERLPADTQFCTGCYNGVTRNTIERIWEEGHVEEHKP